MAKELLQIVNDFSEFSFANYSRCFYKDSVLGLAAISDPDLCGSCAKFRINASLCVGCDTTKHLIPRGYECEPLYRSYYFKMMDNG